MEFTLSQYNEAIQRLVAARDQKITGTTDQGCAICHGSCHPDQCGFNPLYAMHLCEAIAKGADQLHDKLHYLCGVHTLMGETVGPRSVHLPPKEEPDESQGRIDHGIELT